MPVIALVPVTAGATPSLTLVAIVKLLLKFEAGVNVRPASKTLTSARAPLAVQTPVPETYVDVTEPEVPVFKLPAAGLDRVNVAVTLALSASLITMSIRLSGVSSVYVSPALRLVAVGASLTATAVIALIPVITVETLSVTPVVIVKLLL